MSFLLQGTWLGYTLHEKVFHEGYRVNVTSKSKYIPRAEYITNETFSY